MPMPHVFRRIATIILSCVLVLSATADDEQWLKDAKGREYKLESMSKKAGTRIDKTHVQTMWGIAVEVEREDADNYYYKVYKPSKETGPKILSDSVMLERAAANDVLYRSDIKPSE